MAKLTYVDKALEEMGFSVKRFTAGSHELGQIDVDDDVSVIFRQKGGGSGGGSGGVSCLACQISKISQCADLVCPDIKKADPDASCSDEIKECMELACRGSCGTIGSGGGILVLA